MNKQKKILKSNPLGLTHRHTCKDNKEHTFTFVTSMKRQHCIVPNCKGLFGDDRNMNNYNEDGKHYDS